MDNTSLTNLALQTFGNRTVITAAQLAAGSNNEAKQANLTFANTRDSLLRLAPWDCGMKTANLTYITSIPGTPENTSPATSLWQPGQPRPPWAYEYQYPVDCLRACWIIPATQTGFTGVPITTAVTGSAPSTWNGAPIRFKVGTDQFYPCNAVEIVAGGTDYHIGEIITASGGPAGVQPWGGPVRIRVVTTGALGAATSAEIVTQVPDAATPQGGSYFVTDYTNLFTQAAIAPSFVSPAVGAGIIFRLSWGSPISQRVILTNQEYATLCYVQQVTDPNVWDPMFQDAFVQALGGDICYALTGDKTLAKLCYEKANDLIKEARKADGNEGLTINNVTPDWIRARGISWTDDVSGYGLNFDWGGFYGPGW